MPPAPAVGGCTLWRYSDRLQDLRASSPTSAAHLRRVPTALQSVPAFFGAIFCAAAK
nr:MAG TPA: hypothetical protein [Caudoviricetes sp.]